MQVHLGPEPEVVVGHELRGVVRLGVRQHEGVHVAEHDDGQRHEQGGLLPDLGMVMVSSCHMGVKTRDISHGVE